MTKTNKKKKYKSKKKIGGAELASVLPVTLALSAGSSIMEEVFSSLSLTGLMMSRYNKLKSILVPLEKYEPEKDIGIYHFSTLIYYLFCIKIDGQIIDDKNDFILSPEIYYEDIFIQLIIVISQRLLERNRNGTLDVIFSEETEKEFIDNLSNSIFYIIEQIANQSPQNKILKENISETGEKIDNLRNSIKVIALNVYKCLKNYLPYKNIIQEFAKFLEISYKIKFDSLIIEIINNITDKSIINKPQIESNNQDSNITSNETEQKKVDEDFQKLNKSIPNYSQLISMVPKEFYWSEFIPLIHRWNSGSKWRWFNTCSYKDYKQQKTDWNNQLKMSNTTELVTDSTNSPGSHVHFNLASLMSNDTSDENKKYLQLDRLPNAFKSIKCESRGDTFSCTVDSDKNEFQIIEREFLSISNEKNIFIEKSSIFDDLKDILSFVIDRILIGDYESCFYDWYNAWSEARKYRNPPILTNAIRGSGSTSTIAESYLKLKDTRGNYEKVVKWKIDNIAQFYKWMQSIVLPMHRKTLITYARCMKKHFHNNSLTFVSKRVLSFSLSEKHLIVGKLLDEMDIFEKRLLSYYAKNESSSNNVKVYERKNHIFKGYKDDFKSIYDDNSINKSKFNQFVSRFIKGKVIILKKCNVIRINLDDNNVQETDQLCLESGETSIQLLLEPLEDINSSNFVIGCSKRTGDTISVLEGIEMLRKSDYKKKVCTELNRVTNRKKDGHFSGIFSRRKPNYDVTYTDIESKSQIPEPLILKIKSKKMTQTSVGDTEYYYTNISSDEPQIELYLELREENGKFIAILSDNDAEINIYEIDEIYDVTDIDDSLSPDKIGIKRIISDNKNLLEGNNTILFNKTGILYKGYLIILILLNFVINNLENEKIKKKIVAKQLNSFLYLRNDCSDPSKIFAAATDNKNSLKISYTNSNLLRQVKALVREFFNIKNHRRKEKKTRTNTFPIISILKLSTLYKNSYNNCQSDKLCDFQDLELDTFINQDLEEITETQLGIKESKNNFRSHSPIMGNMISDEEYKSFEDNESKKDNTETSHSSSFQDKITRFAHRHTHTIRKLLSKLSSKKQSKEDIFKSINTFFNDDDNTIFGREHIIKFCKIIRKLVNHVYHIDFDSLFSDFLKHFIDIPQIDNTTLLEQINNINIFNIDITSDNGSIIQLIPNKNFMFIVFNPGDNPSITIYFDISFSNSKETSTSAPPHKIIIEINENNCLIIQNILSHIYRYLNIEELQIETIKKILKSDPNMLYYRDQKFRNSEEMVYVIWNILFGTEIKTIGFQKKVTTEREPVIEETKIRFETKTISEISSKIASIHEFDVKIFNINDPAHFISPPLESIEVEGSSRKISNKNYIQKKTLKRGRKIKLSKKKRNFMSIKKKTTPYTLKKNKN